SSGDTRATLLEPRCWYSSSWRNPELSGADISRLLPRGVREARDAGLGQGQPALDDAAIAYGGICDEDTDRFLELLRPHRHLQGIAGIDRRQKPEFHRRDQRHLLVRDLAHGKLEENDRQLSEALDDLGGGHDGPLGEVTDQLGGIAGHALDGLDVFALTVVGDPIEHDERISVLQVLFLHLGEADDPLAVLFDHRSRLSQRGLPERLSRGRNVILALEASERFGASLRAQLETSWRSTKIGQMLQNMLGNYPIGRADPGRRRSLERRLGSCPAY